MDVYKSGLERASVARLEPFLFVLKV